MSDTQQSGCASGLWLANVPGDRSSNVPSVEALNSGWYTKAKVRVKEFFSWSIRKKPDSPSLASKQNHRTVKVVENRPGHIVKYSVGRETKRWSIKGINSILQGAFLPCIPEPAPGLCTVAVLASCPAHPWELSLQETNASGLMKEPTRLLILWASSAAVVHSEGDWCLDPSWSSQYVA